MTTQLKDAKEKLEVVEARVKELEACRSGSFEQGYGCFKELLHPSLRLVHGLVNQ